VTNANARRAPSRAAMLIARDGTDVHAHLALGLEFLGARRWRQAMAELRRVVELDPDYVPGWQALAEALIGAGEIKEACAVLQTGIEIARRDGAARLARELEADLARLPQAA
jgi:Tfp pilus assembly protein PilF